ncbi:MAG: hypothetical protein AABX01_08265 [Candidatus Micrarchaeota archaeon]
MHSSAGRVKLKYYSPEGALFRTCACIILNGSDEAFDAVSLSDPEGKKITTKITKPPAKTGTSTPLT